MQVGIDYGLNRFELDVQEDRLVPVRRAPLAAPITDVPAAVAKALSTPFGFPALFRALTPDDHVALVVDEGLARLGELLPPVLEHLLRAEIAPEAITLVCAPSASSQKWLDDLPEQFEEVQVEIHDPKDRKKVSYLATTRYGRRIYVNRTVVDADQVVVLARRGYDPVLGYAGCEGCIYPALSDEATRKELLGKRSFSDPADGAWPTRQTAEEVAWLLGAPFLVQVIEGAGNEIAHVIGGSQKSSSEGRRLLDERWRMTVDQPAQTVVAAVGGDPARQDFATLARALTAAARVAEPGGKIALLTSAKPVPDAGMEMLRQIESPDEALQLLKNQDLPGLAAAVEWASAAMKCKIYFLSGLDADVAEELFAVPLDKPGQVQKLVEGRMSLILQDPHKAMAVLQPTPLE